jgi:RNA polymerase sigma factor (sigma-70 family)
MASVRLGAAMRQIHLLFGEGTLAGLPDAQILDRYVTQRDELAFTALVQRHGPMVLAVCRGVLDDPNDADDAFQAAFLLLARKAKSLWVDDSLGGWLHRVASRIAFQMKSDAARRRDQERRAAEKAGVRNPSGRSEDDTLRVLHQEIDRLPDRYRKPIVLCYLEHMTYQQAASHLRWSEGTTQGRLARARSLLRARLTRRGVTLGVATLGALALPHEASAVSVSMLLSAVRTARFFGLGEAAGVGTVSTAAEALVKQTLRTMMMAKLKMVAAAGFFIGALTCVATGLSASGPIVAQEPAAAAPQIAPPRHTPEPNAGWERAAVKALLAYRDGKIRPEGALGPQDPRDARAAALSMVDNEPFGNPVNVTRDLKPGTQLNRGDNLFSPLGGFRLHMQRDGNLVLCPIDDEQMPDVQSVLAHTPQALSCYNFPIWSSSTNIPRAGVGSGSYCEMKDDGNFVIYDEDWRPCFSTGTAGHPGAFLRLQNDGNLVIYAPNRKVLWSSNTHAGAREIAEDPAAE